MQKRRKSNSKKKPVNDDSNERETPVYCVCRSSDAERFMIACDQCEEWYHGDCINVTPKQAEQIKTFYCAQCRCKNPSLEIEYKNARSQKPKPVRQTMSPSSSVSNYTDQQLSPKLAKNRRGAPGVLACNSGDSTRRMAPENSHPHSSRDARKYAANDMKLLSIDSPSDIPESTVSPSGIFARNCWPRDREHIQNKRRPCSPRMRPCGHCEGCSLEEDCGKCDFCRDRRKFGGPNRMRQKCRLRQCVGMLSSRSRNLSNSSQGVVARRRKQQPIQGVPIEMPSPRIQSYIDFDDEPFEVPIDLSPRTYPDSSTQNYLTHNSADHSVPVGSKMRRGDHRLPSSANDMDNLAPRQYNRVSLGAPSHSRSKGAVSSIYPLSADEPIDFVNDDSDDDIVLPPITHCAGPACMSAAVPGEKYCSDICKAKHTNSRAGMRPGVSSLRSGLSGLAAREANAVPYNLPYPDHMYCRHHRVQNWHSNGSSSHITSPPYRSINQSSFDHFTFDQAYLSEGLRQPRGHQTFHYPSGPMHHVTRQNNHTSPHPVVLNPNGRLSAVDGQGHTVICDTADTAAFIDSISSAMRRGTAHGFAEDLGIDLPHHPASVGTHLSPSSGLSGVNACYTTSDHADSVRSVDLHNVDPGDRLTADVDDDGDIDSEVPEAVNHPVYGYYMMGYNSETTNGHSQRVSLNNTTLNDRRLDPSALQSSTNIRPMNRRLLSSDNIDASNSVSLNYPSRALTVNSINLRQPSLSNVSGNVNSNTCLNSTGLVGSSVSNNVTSHSMSTYLSGPDEFYTINDSDDLEINWPQETVAGVNG